jgi:hypothetical protein
MLIVHAPPAGQRRLFLAAPFTNRSGYSGEGEGRRTPPSGRDVEGKQPVFGSRVFEDFAFHFSVGFSQHPV